MSTKIIEIDGERFSLEPIDTMASDTDAPRQLYALQPLPKEPQEPEEYKRGYKEGFERAVEAHNLNVPKAPPKEEPEWEVLWSEDKVTVELKNTENEVQYAVYGAVTALMEFIYTPFNGIVSINNEQQRMADKARTLLQKGKK